MKTNSYLYGVDDVPEIPKEVIDARIVILTKHKNKLQTVHREHRAYSQLNDVIKAITFWENLNRGYTI